jgi:hypothetical protein
MECAADLVIDRSLKDAYCDDEPPFAFDVDRDILRGLIRPGAVRGAVEAAQIRDCEGLS